MCVCVCACVRVCVCGGGGGGGGVSGYTLQSSLSLFSTLNSNIKFVLDRKDF